MARKKRNGVFSDSVFNKKNRITVDVSTEFGTKEQKKQMLKVFQQANRRIQNVTSKGYNSSAVAQVIAERGKRNYTYFSGANLDPTNKTQWERLKFEYQKATAFLNNPTSSATGAKQYIQWQANRLNTNFEQANRIVGLATSAEITGSGEMNILNYSNILNSYSADDMLIDDFDSEMSLAYRVENNLQDMLNNTDNRSENELLDSFIKDDFDFSGAFGFDSEENNLADTLKENNDDLEDLTDLIDSDK